MHLTKRERAMIGQRMTTTERVSVNRIYGLKSTYAPRRDPYDEPDQTGKGEFHGKCNVTRCHTRGEDVKWWNRPMRAHYCSYCKREISRFDDNLGTDQAIFETTPRGTIAAPDAGSDS
ncbi:MAG: DHHC family palmitoyltransferase [Pseudomonadota bacterium]|nr:DHHC family palmitoyltransferase [Pseudomonadota bacterium]